MHIFIAIFLFKDLNLFTYNQSGEKRYNIIFIIKFIYYDSYYDIYNINL